MIYILMNVIARKNLVEFYTARPKAKASLTRWYEVVRTAEWKSMNDVQAAFANAKVLNAERVRFEVGGGNYRLIVAFNFRCKIAFIKFVGTHGEYDKIDALTVSQF